ncbi:MAG: hypothetical protein F9K27_12395 [Anaerolineae bacterium]|nr:MAG: hypothetical protein F9K27_12395 [Anaerolineae bacterium]
MTEIVRCRIEGYKSDVQEISLMSDQLSLVMTNGKLGPENIPDALTDLVNLAFVIHLIERMQDKFSGGNRANHYRLNIRVNSDIFTDPKIIDQIQNILLFMGGATWEICTERGSVSILSECNTSTNERRIDQVALFSGGLDSTCGLAIFSESNAITQPVSFYTQQKTRQLQIAVEGLNYSSLVQFTRRVNADSGKGRRSYYRSFFFLTLAALVAKSWGVTRVIQVENGVLATAVSPGEAWYMTRHAHPRLHSECAKLFSDVCGGEWNIENPALLLTKRELYQNAARQIGHDKIAQLAQLTETCWFHRSPTIPGGEKDNNKACGLCIPCIVRRTALQDTNYHYKSIDENVRNDERKGRSFRDYYGFLSEILDLGDNIAGFYNLLPEVSRELLYPEGQMALKDLHSLFVRFAKEYMETFRL